MKYLILTSCFLFINTLVSANNLLIEKLDTEWYRYATISPDGENIAFVYKGDIFVVSSDGGVARQLTIHVAHDYHPVWSKDGKSIAFASNRYGNFDVFVIPVEGGEAKRLTFHSSDEIPYTFSSDNANIIFKGLRMDAADHRQFPNSYLTEVYTVPAYGGRVDQLWTITAEDIVVNSNGDKYLYHDKKGGENEFRKHHVSSVTRDIWMYDKNENIHTKITNFPGEDRNPIFTTDESEFYFLSESSGTFNIHRKGFNEAGEGIQLTNFKDHPVRFLSLSMDGKLCFTQHGSVYIMTDESKQRKLNIVVKSESAENDYTFVPVSGSITELSVSPDGKEVALIVRGEVFATSVEGSMTKQITHTTEEEKYLSFSPDGKKLYYASERLGKWGIYSAEIKRKDEMHFYSSTLIEEKAIRVNEKHNEQPKMSPDGNLMAFTEDKTTLNLLDLNSGVVKTLAGSNELVYMNDGGQEYVWSPDSKWLAATLTPTLANSEIYLIDISGKTPNFNLTQNGHIDYGPEWADSGNVLLWKSTREGKRDYANSGSRQTDVYASFMNEGSYDRFRLSEEEYALWKEQNEKKSDDKDESATKGKKDEKQEPKVVQIDFDGITDRYARLTIHSSSITDATISKDGTKLYYLTSFEDKVNLWTTDLRTKETKMAIPLSLGFGSFTWDAKREHLFILGDGRPLKIKEAELKSEPLKISGKMKVDLFAERKEMFEHVWQRTDVMFYDRNFHGIDWNFYGAAYRSKLASIGNDIEFAELLSEMLGELNVSHCGAGARINMENADQTFSFGFFRDYSHSGDGIKISEILKNGPLDKSTFEIDPGMILIAINGNKILKWMDDAQLLNNLGRDFVAIEILDPKTGKTKTITARPIGLSEEMTLLYDRWVRMNAKEVEEKSNGKLGYVHVPGMGDGPYRSLYGDIMGKYLNCEGIVVDTRFNRGGDLVSDLNMFLSGEEFITYENDQRKIGYEPNFRWTGSNVVLANEANYSDGSCFACGYQQQGIGKLIGMPVPGTCSFASWEGLINGHVYWGSVALSAKDKNGKWMENSQNNPDIEIKNDPNKIVLGVDQQLEGAIKELLK